MNGFSRYLPWGVFGLAGIYVLFAMMGPAERAGDMRIGEFGQLPAVDGGRVKPYDSVARVNLMIVSGRQSFVDEEKKSQPAIKWMLDAMISPPKTGGPADQHKVFRIDNDQVLSLVGLKARSGFRYSIDELRPGFDKLERESHRAQKVDTKDRDLFDVKVLELRQHLETYLEMATWMAPHPVPTASENYEWLPLLRAVFDAKQTGHENPDARSYMAMLQAYHEGDAKAFNEALEKYQKSIAGRYPAETKRARFEVFYNRFAPFYHCSVLYVLVFLLACCGWLGWMDNFNYSAFALAVLTLLVHTWALGARMYLMDRPWVFVTNLYSSAIFIGWAGVLLGLVLERIFTNGIGNVVAAAIGAVTTLVAHNIADGDTLGVMQAVLDTNFWLATHVTCVTIGYAATFVAGFLGIVFVIIGVFTWSLDQALMKTLSQMIYGIVCFATLFSFTGTVLGGIWADQSWGRFWGWDPKENGALIIVMWNALILHARWGGMVKQRGLAVLSIFGNIVTSWSWFGTNLLGVGLHSYGFTSGWAFWLSMFVLSQLLLMGIGLMPMDKWRSFAALRAAPPPSLHRKPRERPRLEEAVTAG